MMIIDTSLRSAIAQAVPVVMGGLLAVAGGVVTQFVTDNLAIKRERRSLRRERLESFVKVLYANQQWLEERFQDMLHRNEGEHRASPLYEAKMIQALYFPQLGAVLQDIIDAEQPMLRYIEQQRHADAQSRVVNIWSDMPYLQAMSTYTVAVKMGVEKCRKLLDSFS